MDLTPLDIEHATFETGLVGFRKASVRAYLERVARAQEQLVREQRALRDELDGREAEIDELREAEAELKRAVIAAERIGNEMKDVARREAELIVANARAEAQAHAREAREQVREAQAELARLERSQALVREQLRGQLTAFLRALDAAPRERLGPPAAAIGEDDLASSDPPADR
jgi:cell division initiation protein